LERFGIAGFGGRGKLIARKLADSGFDVVGVYDSNPAQLANAQFRTFTDIDDLIKLNLDVLMVTTWPSSHAAITEKALEQGLDVFVEKPMGANLAQSLQIVRAQRRTAKLVAVGYVERFNPAIIKLRDIAELTDVVRSREIRIGLTPPTGQETGVLLDLGSHGIDIAYHLFAKEPKVRCAILSTDEQSHLEYECIIELDFGKTRSCVEARYGNIRRRRLELDTEHEYYEVTYTPASLKIGFPPPKLRTRPRNWEDLEQLSKNVETTFELPRKEPINAMLQLLVESVRKGSVIEPLCNADQALVTTRAIDEAKKRYAQISQGTCCPPKTE
jgi:predicted dehydrogenase